MLSMLPDNLCCIFVYFRGGLWAEAGVDPGACASLHTVPDGDVYTAGPHALPHADTNSCALLYTHHQKVLRENTQTNQGKGKLVIWVSGNYVGKPMT